MSDVRARAQKQKAAPVLVAFVFLTVWLGGSSCIVAAFLQPVLPGIWIAVALSALFFLAPAAVLMRGFSGTYYPTAAVRLFVLRPFWYAIFAIPLMAIAAVVGAAVGLPFHSAGPGARWGMVAMSVFIVVTGVLGYIGTRRLTVKELRVDLPRLPSAFDGLRIVQFSDIHVGPHTSKEFMRRIAHAVQDTRPDVIVITGDQVDDFAQDVHLFNGFFGGLEAPEGVFAVLGNHDVYAGWKAVHRGMQEAGFRVLLNESVALERGGQRLWIAGTGDPAGSLWPPAGTESPAPDLPHTFAGIPEGAPVVALAHNPVLWPALVRQGADLTLSGHTHYGQFAMPSRSWSLASMFLDHAMGAYREAGSLLYINPGTNFWGIAVRIGSFPEITVFDLHSTDGEPTIVETSQKTETG